MLTDTYQSLWAMSFAKPCNYSISVSHHKIYDIDTGKEKLIAVIVGFSPSLGIPDDLMLG